MTDKELIKTITEHQTALEHIRTPYESTWKEITRFIAPSQDFWGLAKEHTGDSLQRYDGTPLSALNLMANGLQGYMASSSTKSFKLNLEGVSSVKHQPYGGRIRSYLQDLEDVFYWMINRSNFYNAIQEVFFTGGALATSVLSVERVPGTDYLVFTPEHIKYCWIAANSYREVDTVHRKLMIPARDIVKRWKDKLKPSFLKQAIQKPYATHEVLHAVYPREERDDTKIDKLNKKFASVWIMGDTLLEESGFNENPYTVWRWSTPGGSTYGWGPGHDALADVLRINQMGRSLLIAAQKQVEPPMNVPQGQLYDLRPNGMNPYTDPRKIISPIQTVGNYPIGIEREQKIQDSIKDHFFVQMFLMLNQAGATKERTATEVLEMQSEKAAILGAITSRIESELFDKLFDGIFAIASAAGWLPPPPPELLDILGDKELRIDYVGPMAQMQKRFYSQQSIDKPMQRIIAYGQIYPEIMDIIDSDRLGRHMINDSALPQDLIRSKKDTDAIRRQRAQMQQEAQAAEIAQKQAKALKDMGDTKNLEGMVQ